jgi:hypothetical protein
MQVKLLTQLTTVEIRHLARTAANRDDPLDIANVFPIGTEQHAVFTTEYLSQFSALDESGQGLQLPLPVGCYLNEDGHALGIPARAGTGIRDP